MKISRNVFLDLTILFQFHNFIVFSFDNHFIILESMIYRQLIRNDSSHVFSKSLFCFMSVVIQYDQSLYHLNSLHRPALEHDDIILPKAIPSKRVKSLNCQKNGRKEEVGLVDGSFRNFFKTCLGCFSFVKIVCLQ